METKVVWAMFHPTIDSIVLYFFLIFDQTCARSWCLEGKNELEHLAHRFQTRFNGKSECHSPPHIGNNLNVQPFHYLARPINIHKWQCSSAQHKGVLWSMQSLGTPFFSDLYATHKHENFHSLEPSSPSKKHYNTSNSCYTSYHQFSCKFKFLSARERCMRE